MPGRLPPPGFSAPGHQCPSPEPRSTPAGSAHLRAPVAACASLLQEANQHPERRGGNAAIQPTKAGRRGGASWRSSRARAIEDWRAARFHPPRVALERENRRGRWHRRRNCKEGEPSILKATVKKIATNKNPCLYSSPGSVSFIHSSSFTSPSLHLFTPSSL